ncbi:hypothetical protein BKA67DRAFT_692574 [Truncatella angustata]|uniref:Uncharacterized protein n=1 Tax=Truncatella angustata TaxID=152316 RepID=A0A9P8UJJ6_9PEZI|nr:uncharacterized protein BKA67DRAFT_692574 [Truncatella angustata]KAH6653367.1 hypothetical protein BKA67DRAFT_692574 [Truncatella angustata]
MGVKGDVFDLTLHGSDQNLPEPGSQPAPASAIISKIRVNSTKDCLERFDRVFHETEQRQSVQDIVYEVVLPPVSAKRLKKLQSSREAAANNVAFTQGIFDLFDRLRAWKGNEVSVTLEARSLSDDAEVLDDIEINHDGPEIWRFRNLWKFLMVDEGTLPSGVLPEVGYISKLDFRWLSENGRSLHPKTAGIIAAALPRARDMTWGLLMPGRRLLSLRKEFRSALAQVLLKTAFPAVEILKIYLEDGNPYNDSFELESYCEKEEEDDLSLAVRRLLRLPTLANLELGGCWILSPTAFLAAAEIGVEIISSTLTDLHLDLSVATPTGGWINTGDNPRDVDDDTEDSDSDVSHASFNSAHSDHSDFVPENEWLRADGELPQNCFRDTPDPSTFDPLVLSLVRMVPKLPNLKKLCFDLGAGGGAIGQLTVTFYAPGQPSRRSVRRPHSPLPPQEDFDEKNLQRARWYVLGLVDFNRDWRMSDELRAALQGANTDGVEIFMSLCNQRIEGA